MLNTNEILARFEAADKVSVVINSNSIRLKTRQSLADIPLLVANLVAKDAEIAHIRESYQFQLTSAMKQIVSFKTERTELRRLVLAIPAPLFDSDYDGLPRCMCASTTEFIPGVASMTDRYKVTHAPDCAWQAAQDYAKGGDHGSE